MRTHRNNFGVFYPNVIKYLQHFYKLSFSFIFQAVIKPFKSCSRLTLNITVIKQKLTFKEKICHDVVFCYTTFWAIFFHLSCIIKLTTKLQILTHSSSAYFLIYAPAVNILRIRGFSIVLGHSNYNRIISKCLLFFRHPSSQPRSQGLLIYRINRF